jgi:hypothetical protein
MAKKPKEVAPPRELITLPPTIEMITERMGWAQVYWVQGAVPKHWDHRNEVSDPPCPGWSLCYVIRSFKTVTLFCPFTFQTFSVSPASSEFHSLRTPFFDGKYRPDFMSKYLPEKWAMFLVANERRDFDMAAVVMKELGLEIPMNLPTSEADPTKERGGKETEVALKKPVKRDSKRGKFLEFFLADGGGLKSIREVMAQFDITRSNALSYLYMLQKDHGIGYKLVGDGAEVSLPEGCADPFGE